MADFGVRGIGQLTSLAKDLKAAGDKDLRKEMLQGLRKAGKELSKVPKEAAAQQLPQGGGLARYIATSRVSVRTRTGGQNPGVRLVGAKNKQGGRVDLNSIDRGRVRHKTFGRPPWSNQWVTPGFWSKSLESAPSVRVVRNEMITVLDVVRYKLSRGSSS